MRLATPLKLGKGKKAAMVEGEGRGGVWGAGNKTTGIREKCVKGEEKKESFKSKGVRTKKKKLIYIL